VAIEEFCPFTYPNFGQCQHAAVRDNRSKIAERAAWDGLSPKPSLRRTRGAINLLKSRDIEVINCRPVCKKFIRDIL
jgi:hypothetical protein